MTTPTRAPHEIALRAWAASVLGVVVYSDQRAPRLALPYSTLLVLSDAAEGLSAEQHSAYVVGTDTLDHSYIQRRSGTVSIQCFGVSHWLMARQLENSIQRDSVRAANEASGLTVAFVSTPARRLSLDTNNVTDDRTVIEFAFRYIDIESDNTAYFIDSAQSNGSYT